MKQYHDFLQHILDNGKPKSDRTGTGTLSVFGYQMRFDLDEGFPLMTTKKVHWPSVAHELLWFINGDTNIKYLVDNNVRIWNEWPYENFKKHADYNGETMQEFIDKIKGSEVFAIKHGDLGPVYGRQWRNFNNFDQLSWVVDEIKKNPESRRLIVNAWNAAQVHLMALPPCHMMYQFYVNDDELSLQLYQRSADAFLGVPFNIASYSLLLMMVAQATGLKAKEFIMTIGDAHLYNDHFEQARLQLSRDERPLPKISLTKTIDNLFDFRYNDITLENYNPHPAIKAKVSV